MEIKQDRSPFDKAQDAQNLIEEAQGLLNEAASSIHSIKGMADEYKELCKLSDQIKASWYLVERGKEKIVR